MSTIHFVNRYGETLVESQSRAEQIDVLSRSDYQWTFFGTEVKTPVLDVLDDICENKSALPGRNVQESIDIAHSAFMFQGLQDDTSKEQRKERVKHSLGVSILAVVLSLLMICELAPFSGQTGGLLSFLIPASVLFLFCSLVCASVRAGTCLGLRHT